MGYLAYLDKTYNYYEDKEYYLSQDFIYAIRDSGGFNFGRLLIIPMLTTDFELNYFTFDYFEYKIPKDPHNKLAISIYYYFPCQDNNPMDIFDPINLYDNFGNSEKFFPVMEWGSSMNFGNIISNFNYMKQNFTDKGFPIIIGEAGILNDYIKNNIFQWFLQYIKIFFSIKKATNGLIIIIKNCLIKFPKENQLNHLIIIFKQIYRLKILKFLEVILFMQVKKEL
jgi:hypothetical protein